MKKTTAQLIYILLFLLSCLAGTAQQSSTSLVHLRCEYLKDPLGIDNVTPQLGWMINAGGQKDVMQTAYQVLVASSLSKLRNNSGDIWDSKKVASSNSTHVMYGSSGAATPLESERECFWKVRVWTSSAKGKEIVSAWSEPASWSMGLLNKTDWKASWIGLNEHPALQDSSDEHRRLPARFLRREFPVNKKVNRATAYVCGLGFFDLYLNGELIGDQLMNPSLTGYDKRLLYVTYDVTKNIKPGNNALGAILSNGRFFAPRIKDPVPMYSYGYPRLFMQVNIEYTDGTKEIVASDEKWKVTSNGPIRASNEYDGEEYDARMEINNWAAAGFNDVSWKRADMMQNPGGKMEAQTMEPIRMEEIIRPKKILQPKPGIFMVDFGQSFYGVVRLKVTGPAGTQVKLHSSFNVLPNGLLKYQNDRSALNMDVYTLKGVGTEIWNPRFKGNATRWVQVEGFPGTPTEKNFEGVVIHTDFETTGEFSSSNILLNKIYLNTKWGTRMQNRSVPMEPDRDERMPWSGHPAKTSESEGWVFNVARFYDHFLKNYRAHQGDDGSLQEILPPYWTFNSKGILWPSVATVIPDWLYSFYGDDRFLKENFQMMKKFVLFTQHAYLKSDYTTDFCDYGDWVNAIHMGGTGEETPKGLMGTAYLYNNCRLVQRAARISGSKEDEDYFKTIADKIAVGFNERFLDKTTGIYTSGSQCAYVLPLAFGLVPDQYKDKVIANLVKDIMETRNGHTSVGLIGMQWQMQVLSAAGHPEVAYTIATRTDLPSWGYMVSKGATTSWELWNTDTSGPGMNGESQKILSGNFEAWCYQTLGGINYDTSNPGFRHIILKPEPVGDLTYINSSFNSLFGKIVSNWKLNNGTFSWNISVPPNTTADVIIPGESPVSIDGKDVSLLKPEKDPKTGRTLLHMGSGDYTLTSTVR